MYMAVEGRVVVVKVKVGAHSIDRVSGPCNSWFHLKKKKVSSMGYLLLLSKSI